MSDQPAFSSTRTPVAFISHSWKDKAVARPLAEGLMKKGVDVFFDEWEIGPGDSIRQKIDKGLGNCTHFIVILSPNSLLSEWVQIEIDAGMVRRISTEARFIPLRLGLTIPAIPPTMQGMHSPSLDDLEKCLIDLDSAIHGKTRKPPLGAAPVISESRSEQVGAWSPAAAAIAKLISEKSESGHAMDPMLEPDDIYEATDLATADIVDAIHELEILGLVRRENALGTGEIGFVVVGPTSAFFLEFDPLFNIGKPEDDARIVGSMLVADYASGASTPELADILGWKARRMNPAVAVLEARGLIMTVAELDPTWAATAIYPKPGLRGFLRGNR